MRPQSFAPVAQLDRVLPSEGRGHRFESCRARQLKQDVTAYPVPLNPLRTERVRKTYILQGPGQKTHPRPAQAAGDVLHENGVMSHSSQPRVFQLLLGTRVILRGAQMSKSLMTVIFSLILFCICPTAAQAQDGNELLMQCQSLLKILDDDLAVPVNTGAMYCAGMMMGVRTTLQFAAQGMIWKGYKEVFCVPQIGNDQAARIVVKYLKDNPAKLHEPNALLAIGAFIDAYPCDSK